METHSHGRLHAKGKQVLTVTTFTWNGEPIRKSTKQTNKRVAEQMEAAHKTSLAKREVGIVERTPAPTLKQFSERFMQAVSVRGSQTVRGCLRHAAPVEIRVEFAAGGVESLLNRDLIDQDNGSFLIRDRFFRIGQRHVQ